MRINRFFKSFFEKNNFKKLIKDHKKFYEKNFSPRKHISNDFGRALQDYNRIDLFLKKKFRRGLKGKNIMHLGSGNTVYCDYLTRKGAKAFAIDSCFEYLKKAKAKGSKAILVNVRAEKMGLKPETLDVVIADHFLFSGFFIGRGQNSEKNTNRDIVNNVVPALKKGGLLIVERAYIENVLKNELKKTGLKLLKIEEEKIKDQNGKPIVFAQTNFYVFEKQ